MQSHLNTSRFLVITGLVLSLLAFALRAWAWNEPTDFRGLRFGVDVRQVLPRCPASYATPRTGPCWNPASGSEALVLEGYEDVEAARFEMVLARQIDDGLELISASFASRDFDTFLAIFKARYGPPSLDMALPLQNRLGAMFSAREVYWHGTAVSVSLSERAGRVDRGMAMWVTEKARQQDIAQRQEQISRGAKGL